MACGVHLGLLLICLVQAKHVLCLWATQDHRQHSDVGLVQQDSGVSSSYPQNQLRQAFPFPRSAQSSSRNAGHLVSSDSSKGISGSGYIQPRSGHAAIKYLSSSDASLQNPSREGKANLVSRPSKAQAAPFAPKSSSLFDTDLTPHRSPIRTKTSSSVVAKRVSQRPGSKPLKRFSTRKNKGEMSKHSMKTPESQQYAPTNTYTIPDQFGGFSIKRLKDLDLAPQSYEPPQRQAIPQVQSYEPPQRQAIPQVQSYKPPQRQVIPQVQGYEPPQRQVIPQVQAVPQVQSHEPHHAVPQVQRQVIAQVQGYEPSQRRVIPQVQGYEPPQRRVIPQVQGYEPPQRRVIPQVQGYEPSQRWVNSQIQTYEPSQRQVIPQVQSYVVSQPIYVVAPKRPAAPQSFVAPKRPAAPQSFVAPKRPAAPQSFVAPQHPAAPPSYVAPDKQSVSYTPWIPGVDQVTWLRVKSQ